VPYITDFDTAKLTHSDLVDIATWLRETKTPTGCDEFFQRGYHSYASNLYISPGDENLDKAEDGQIFHEISQRSFGMVESCALYDGHTDFEIEYIRFDASETKELKLTGIEGLPSPPDGLGVSRLRQPLLVSCWRA
jgi:hypothetical protein